MYNETNNNGTQTPVQASNVPPVSYEPPVAPVSPAPAVPPMPPTVGVVPAIPVTTSTPNPKLNIPKMDPKEIFGKIKTMPLKFKIMGGFVLVLIILLVLVGFTNPGKKVKNLILPTNSPIPTSAPVGDVSIPSPYANDPEVLDLEKRLTDYETNLGNAKLNEDTLRPPSLDWNVNFKTQ